MAGEGRGVRGAIEIEGTAPFDEQTNFVDLHLDFPVSFDKYQMGATPFLRALQRSGFQNMEIHTRRLSYLNEEAEHFHAFGVLLKLYARERITPFKLNAARTFHIEMASDLPQDVNAALYVLIAKVMAPFEFPGQSESAVNLYMEKTFGLAQKHKTTFDAFVDEIVDVGFLKNLQHDCLEIYPQILAAELPMRPALFLDFDQAYKDNPIPMRVSVSNFESLKDLFKDIAEIISRQFILVAGINNLLKRGSHNDFKPQIGMTNSGRDLTPKSLNAYADIDFGKKQDFIDDPWYTIQDGAVSTRLRNAIAHNKAEYDEVRQLVTYYPKKEGMAQEKAETISFLEFMRWLLCAYREMHRLHHLIKALFYYRYLIQKPRQPL